MNGDVGLERFLAVLSAIALATQLAPQLRDAARVLLERRRRLQEQRDEMDRLWLAREEARVQAAYEELLAEVRSVQREDPSAG